MWLPTSDRKEAVSWGDQATKFSVTEMGITQVLWSQALWLHPWGTPGPLCWTAFGIPSFCSHWDLQKSGDILFGDFTYWAFLWATPLSLFFFSWFWKSLSWWEALPYHSSKIDHSLPCLPHKWAHDPGLPIKKSHSSVHSDWLRGMHVTKLDQSDPSLGLLLDYWERSSLLRSTLLALSTMQITFHLMRHFPENETNSKKGSSQSRVNKR